ncbi:MAG: FAD-dependent oxidoreductase [Thermodesulfobacteriota bacterium]
MPGHPRLFRPIAVGAHRLPNRVMIPSMGTNLADEQGRVTPNMIDYYAARAAGGPGLLVVEAACVHPSGRVIEHHLMNAEAGALDGLAQLARAATAGGVKAILQLIHGGRNSLPGPTGETIAPSALRGPTGRSTPRAMTTLEIEALVDCFARAAARAVVAGFAGVEVHGAHEYLVHQFLTPYCNRRGDDYGGDLMGRARFALEVVRAVRRAIGPEPILAFRLSGDDHVRGGLTPEEAGDIAVLLEEAGVDLFSVTGGVYETPHLVVPPLPMPAGTHLEAAAAVKRRVKAPVAAVGRFNRPEQAEAALKRVDMVAVGRAFLADPQWLNKARDGREAAIRPCIGCNQGCIDRVLEGLAVSCVANPWVGRGGVLEAQPPAPPGLNVVVVGGGLAGMEAALSLGRLGYRVVLFEAEARLGGQVPLAAAPTGKAEFQRLVDFYQRELAGLASVEVRLNTRATVAKVCACRPAAVVVASGSAPLLPQIPGADEAPMVTARQVLAGLAAVGKKVAVLGGGNLGSEVASFLAERGHEVCVIELGLTIGADLGPARRYLRRKELGEQGIRRYVRALVRRLYPDRVSFLHIAADGSRELSDVGPVDTFVAALGARPVEDLYLALEPKVEHLFLVGDALTPARMGEATREGADAALAAHAALLADPNLKSAACEPAAAAG